MGAWISSAEFSSMSVSGHHGAWLEFLTPQRSTLQRMVNVVVSHATRQSPAGLTQLGHCMHRAPYQGHRSREGRDYSGPRVPCWPFLTEGMYIDHLYYSLHSWSPGSVHEHALRTLPWRVGAFSGLASSLWAPEFPAWRHRLDHCLISVTASPFPPFLVSHMFSHVTKVISSRDSGLPCVTSCHPHSLLAWDPPLLQFCEVTGQSLMGCAVSRESLN